MPVNLLQQVVLLFNSVLTDDLASLHRGVGVYSYTEGAQKLHGV